MKSIVDFINEYEQRKQINLQISSKAAKYFVITSIDGKE